MKFSENYDEPLDQRGDPRLPSRSMSRLVHGERDAYLKQDAILPNVPTLRLVDAQARKHVLAELHRFVVKPVSAVPEPPLLGSGPQGLSKA